MLRSTSHGEADSFAEKPICDEEWPKPPIWPEDLPLIRELLTDEEYAELLTRTVQVVPNGPLLDHPQAFAEQELKAPNAAGTLGTRSLGSSFVPHLRQKSHSSITQPSGGCVCQATGCYGSCNRSRRYPATLQPSSCVQYWRRKRTRPAPPSWTCTLDKPACVGRAHSSSPSA